MGTTLPKNVLGEYEIGVSMWSVLAIVITRARVLRLWNFTSKLIDPILEMPIRSWILPLWSSSKLCSMCHNRAAFLSQLPIFLVATILVCTCILFMIYIHGKLWDNLFVIYFLAISKLFPQCSYDWSFVVLCILPKFSSLLMGSLIH